MNNIIIIFDIIFTIVYLNLFLTLKSKYFSFVFFLIKFLILIIAVFFKINIFIYFIIDILYGFICFYDNKYKILFFCLCKEIIYIVCINVSLFIVNFILNNNISNFITIPDSIYYLIYFFVNFFMLYFSYTIFKNFQSNNRYLSFKEQVLFMINTMIIFICIYLICNYPINLAGDFYNFYLMFLILLLLSIFVFLAFYIKTTNEKQKQMLSIKLKEYSSSIDTIMFKNLEETYKKSQKINHDLKNHMIALKSRINYGTKEDVLEYIKCIEQSIPTNRYISTGNYTLDYIVNTKISLLNDIDFQYKIEDDLSFLNIFDLVTIVGNLLDNSLEALKNVENKQLVLNIRVKDNTTVLEIINSYTYIKSKNNKLKTTKENIACHGFGLKNVEEAVIRNNGKYSYKILDNHLFKTEIIFNNI